MHFVSTHASQVEILEGLHGLIVICLITKMNLEDTN